MIKNPTSNKFAVLGEMEKAQSQRKEILFNQYNLIFSLLENCMQLEDDVAVKEVLQRQVDTVKLLQNGETPSLPKKNALESKMNTLETKLNHLLTTCNAIHKVTSTSTASLPSISLSAASPSASVSSTGPKTYAQVTAEQNDTSPSPPSRSAQKEKEASKTEHKSEKRQRLLVKVTKEAMQNFNGLQLRNLINDAFFMHNIAFKAVVAAVVKSFSGQSIIIVTMANYSSDFLLHHKDIWQEPFSESINSDLKLEKDEKWGKFVLHDIPTKLFNMEDGMLLLREELEQYNPGLTLKKDPVWLTSWEKRDVSRTASVLVFVENVQQATRTHVLVSSLQLRVYEYKEKDLKTFLQCFNCQRWGHSARDCMRKTVCQLCAGAHFTKGHTCSICKKIGVICPHTEVKCGNCGEKHAANSTFCCFFPRKDQTKQVSAATEKRKFQEMDCVLIPVPQPQQLKNVCLSQEPVRRSMKKTKTQC